jgi:hypothetical protein
MPIGVKGPQQGVAVPLWSELAQWYTGAWLSKERLQTGPIWPWGCRKKDPRMMEWWWFGFPDKMRVDLMVSSSSEGGAFPQSPQGQIRLCIRKEF